MLSYPLYVTLSLSVSVSVFLPPSLSTLLLFLSPYTDYNILALFLSLSLSTVLQSRYPLLVSLSSLSLSFSIYVYIQYIYPTIHPSIHLSLSLTHEAGLAQVGDGLSVVSAGLRGRGAGTGDALCVGHRGALLQRVQQRWTDMVIPRGAGCVVPDRKEKNNH